MILDGGHQFFKKSVRSDVEFSYNPRLFPVEATSLTVNLFGKINSAELFT
jgi:hypothetical protein